MARRSDHSRDQLALLVIEAARDLVVADGPNGVTMRRIAERIGYAPGSIYNAVGDIEAVMLRVNAGTLAGLAQRLDTALQNRDAASEPLGTAILVAEHYVDYVINNARLWSVLLESPQVPGKPVPAFYLDPRTRLIDIVATTIEPMFPDPTLRRRAVAALWAALQGVASLAIGGNLQFVASDLDAKDIARSIVVRYLTGVERSSEEPQLTGGQLTGG